jgi:hypothetical protein
MAWPLSGRTNEMSEDVALCHLFSVKDFAWRNAKTERYRMGLTVQYFHKLLQKH